MEEENLRLDILNENLKIWQNKSSFCYGIDAVLLSDFARARKLDRVFDLGTGNGIIPLLMMNAGKGAHFTALEIQKETALLAQKNAAENGFSEKIEIKNVDIKAVPEVFEKRCAEVVVSNPPYMTGQTKTQDENESRRIARHEVFCTVFDVMKAASHLLTQYGTFFMIHRPERLSDIFSAAEKNSLTIKRLQMVAPESGKAPNLVILEIKPNAKPGLTVEKELYVYREPGIYSEEMIQVRKRMGL